MKKYSDYLKKINNKCLNPIIFKDKIIPCGKCKKCKEAFNKYLETKEKEKEKNKKKRLERIRKNGRILNGFSKG